MRNIPYTEEQQRETTMTAASIDNDNGTECGKGEGMAELKQELGGCWI